MLSFSDTLLSKQKYWIHRCEFFPKSVGKPWKMPASLPFISKEKTWGSISVPLLLIIKSCKRIH